MILKFRYFTAEHCFVNINHRWATVLHCLKYVCYFTLDYLTLLICYSLLRWVCQAIT